MITQPWIQQLGWSLLHFLWQGMLLASLLAVLLVCLQRQPASVRYLVRCAALVLMALCPLITWGYLDQVPEPVHVHDTLSPEANVAAVPGATSSTFQEDGPLADQLLTGFVAAWALGALWFLARLLVGFREVRRLMRRCESPMPQAWQRRFQGLRAAFQVQVSARLTRSAQVAVPVVVGWVRPVVLLPARLVSGMTEEQVAALLAHELAHVRRHDALVNLGQTLIESIFFYHPAVWWVSHGIRVEREFCCDDMAVAAMGRALPYARALATLETIRGAEPRLVPSSRGGPLMMRVQRLVGDRGATDRGFLLRSLPGAVGLLLMGALGASAWASSADPMGADDEKKVQRRVVLTLETGTDGKPVLVKSVTLDEHGADACPECGHRTAPARRGDVIRGRVVDPRGEPVQDTRVRWVENRPVMDRESKDAGIATVDVNRDGLLDVWVTATDGEGRFRMPADVSWRAGGEGAEAGADGGEGEARLQWRRRVQRVDPADHRLQQNVAEWTADGSIRPAPQRTWRVAPKDSNPAEGEAKVRWHELGSTENQWLEEVSVDVEWIDTLLADETVVDLLDSSVNQRTETTFDRLLQDATVNRSNTTVDETRWVRTAVRPTKVEKNAVVEWVQTAPRANVVIDRLDPRLNRVVVQDPERPVAVDRVSDFIERVHVIADEEGRLTNNFVLEESPASSTAETRGRTWSTSVKERLVDDAARTYQIELRGEVTLTPTGIQANELTVVDFSKAVDAPVRVIENNVRVMPPQLHSGEYRVRLEAKETKGPDGEVHLEVVPVMGVDLEVVPVMGVDLSLPKGRDGTGQKDAKQKNTKGKAKSKKADTIKVRRISM